MSLHPQCPSCAWGSLDLSPSLFGAFTSLDAGVFQMTWEYGSGGGDSNNNAAKNDDDDKPAPKTTSTSKWVAVSSMSLALFSQIRSLIATPFPSRLLPRPQRQPSTRRLLPCVIMSFISVASLTWFYFRHPQHLPRPAPLPRPALNRPLPAAPLHLRPHLPSPARRTMATLPLPMSARVVPSPTSNDWWPTWATWSPLAAASPALKHALPFSPLRPHLMM